jgi:tRNA U38,U39,U40 pseudouridine synthase TruA
VLCTAKKIEKDCAMDDKLMTRIVNFVVFGGLTVGGGAALISQTRAMAKAAIEAQQHQMSYSKFTKALVSKQPANSIKSVPKANRP